MESVSRRDVLAAVTVGTVGSAAAAASAQTFRSIRATTPGGEWIGMRQNVMAVTARAFAM